MTWQSSCLFIIAAGGGPIPFNTQFFQDDFDQTGFDDDEMEVDAALPMIPDNMDEEGDLLAQTQGPLKRVRPEFVNYARKAKRVDVRKLKENIWKGLKIITPKEADPEVSEPVFTFQIVAELTASDGYLSRRIQKPSTSLSSPTPPSRAPSTA